MAFNVMHQSKIELVFVIYMHTCIKMFVLFGCLTVKFDGMALINKVHQVLAICHPNNFSLASRIRENKTVENYNRRKSVTNRTSANSHSRGYRL